MARRVDPRPRQGYTTDKVSLDNYSIMQRTVEGPEGQDSQQRRLAETLLEVAAGAIGLLRAEVRRHRPGGLALSQFRALAYIYWHPGASLTEVAEHLGLGLSSASRLADSLLQAGLLTRETSAADRRCLVLHLTPAGRRLLEEARERAVGRLAQALEGLSAEEAAAASQALAPLARLLFSRPERRGALTVDTEGGAKEE